MAIQAPQIHSYYIRYAIGTKVVTIFGERSGGTGFHIKAKSGRTYILTNNHICNLADDNDQLEIFDITGMSLKRKVIKRHTSHDLCLVEPMPEAEGINLALNVSVGEIVGLIGHPGLRPLSLSRGEIVGETEISLIVGVNLPEDRCFGKTLEVTELTNPFLVMSLIQQGIETLCVVTELKSTMFNGISYGGNSGSPVVNFYGNLVGVLFAGSAHVTDSYLVPLRYVREFLKKF